MANDMDGDARRPSPAEARDALAGLDADGANLADRLVTPAWYHPILGLIVAAFIGTLTLPNGVSAVVVPVLIVALPALMLAYRNRYGIWMSDPAGPRSRRAIRAIASVLALCFIAALVVKVTEIDPAWVLLPAATALIATVVLGRRYDELLRRDLREASPA